MSDFGISALGLFIGLSAIALLLFLGGFMSAAYEIHRERRLGLVPTRPAWDKREHRTATGGRLAYCRGLAKGFHSGWFARGSR